MLNAAFYYRLSAIFLVKWLFFVSNPLQLLDFLISRISVIMFKGDNEKTDDNPLPL